MITATIIANSVGNTLYSYFAKKGLDKLFKTKDEFTSEINRVIFDTLDDYIKLYPVQNQGDKFPFYRSQKIIEELLKFRVMHCKDYNVEELWNSFRSEPNVIPPTKTNIENFYEIFIAKAEASEALRKAEIKKTFDEEIFYVSKRIEELQKSIDSLIDAFNSDVTLQWKSRIEAYVETIKNFKLQTALKLLESLKSSFDETTQKPSNEISSIVEYQLGLCKNFLNQPQDAAKAFIRAYTLNPKNESYKEQAAFMYYRLKVFESSQNLVRELLSADQFNSVAWAVTLLMTDDFAETLKDVPFIVKTDIRYIKILLQSLASEGRKDLIQILRVEGLIPAADSCSALPLTIDSFGTHLFWIQVATQEFFQSGKFDFYERENNITPSLRILNNLTQRFVGKIKGSEIDSGYEVIYFLDAYSTFILTGDEAAVSKVQECYTLLKVLDPALTAFCANVLQIANLDDAAINVLENDGDKDVNCLNLLAFCYGKNSNMDGFVATTRKVLDTIKIIPENYFPSHLNSMVRIRAFNKQAEFKIAEFTDKEFSSQDEKKFATALAQLLFGEISKEKIADLNELIEIFPEPQYLSLIATTYYFVAEYELSVTLFRRFINYQEPDRDLIYYMYSLYNTKKNTDEMLRLLERWRTNFEFNAPFLKAEFQLRGELLDYSTCIEIAQYYMARMPQDEDMLVNYAASLYYEGTDKSTAELVEYLDTLRDFQYSSTINVATVANILTKRKHFQASLELLYRYATLEENKALRMDFFMACVQAAQNNNTSVLQEFEIVEVGTYVKYELNRKVLFTEISTSNQNGTLQKAFLGKAVNDVIPVKRPFTDEEDLIKILRIMNKYLSLHDEILEEVKDNPHSGIPMASFEFDSNEPESMLTTMQKLFGATGSEHKDYRERQIEGYYKSEISFSELVFTTLENDYLAAYFYLIFANRGIMSIPSIFYRHDVPKGTKFVIDFSSLIIIFQICKRHAVAIPDKVFISKHIIDRLRKELDKKRNEVTPSMSLAITTDDVTAYHHKQATTESDLKYLEDLLQWIELNCEVTFSARFGDFSRSAEYRDEHKAIFDYTINTVLIVEDQSCMLVTDDTFYMKSGFVQPIRQCSSEMFIKHVCGNENSCLTEFLINKYIGFSPTADQLNNEYAKKIVQAPNSYSLCLQNINILTNPETTLPTIDHVKNIALQISVVAGQQEKDIIDVFVHLLRGAPYNIRAAVESMTQLRCILLGQRLNMIVHCLRAAFAILDSDYLKT